MKKYITLIAFLCSTTFTIAQQQDSTVENVLFEIDLDSQIQVLHILQSKQPNALHIADSVLANYNDFYPPVLYAASRVLYDAKRKYEAGFIFYLAQLKARVDVSLCLDNTVTNILVTLNKVYVASINNFSLQHKDSFTNTINKVINIVMTTDGNYDHRWVILRGRFAGQIKATDKVTNDDIILPKEQWQDVKAIVVEAYKKNFFNFIKGKDR